MACSSGVVSTTPFVHQDGSVINVSMEGGVANQCRYQKDFPVEFQPVDILILFDRSSSMIRALGSTTRFESAATFVANLVATYSTKVRWGYADFPGGGDCAEWSYPGCCASGPRIGLATENVEQVQSAIKTATPRAGSSPLALALELSRGYYETLEDDGRARFILLATDGEPSCTLASELSPSVLYNPAGSLLPSPCYDALASISRLISQGIRIIILGVAPSASENPDGRPSCLDLLSTFGSGPITSNQPSFYSFSTREQIGREIEQALRVGDSPSCTFELIERPSGFEGAQVLLDHEEIPYESADGWVMTSMTRPIQFEVLGKACERIRHFQVKTLEMRYPCAVCLESVCP